jgi:hypothetical protein
MKVILCGVAVVLLLSFRTSAQVDTTYIYNNNAPYGSLDIRIANSSTWYYYLDEGKTFSYRESAPGVRTNTFFDMTSWDSSPYTEGNLREKNPSGDFYRMNYRMMTPENYNATYSPGYPLLLMLGGLEESGNCSSRECHFADASWDPNQNVPPAPTAADSPLLNNDHHLTTGARYHLQAHLAAKGKLPNDPSLPATAWPGFIVLPQHLNGWDVSSAQDAIRLVRLLCKKYNIDKNRIYIQGLSNGGHGAFEVIKRAPWMFAAALTMSPIDDALVNQMKLVPLIAHIPLWDFQGGQDINPYPQKTENMIKKFRDAGMVVRYTKYEDLAHATWNAAYHEPDYFTWILGKNKSDLHSFAGATTICDVNGLQLELPSGYLAYQWQLNNQTIGGANTSTYKATTGGVYRARFSRVANPTEAQWNQWSNPITIQAGQPISQAQINQKGTVILPDLNNNSNASLEAVGEFSHYYWYKNGTLVDFPGDQDDTLKIAKITPTNGNGSYTLVTANAANCSSPASAPKTIFFNNSAPLNITAPSGLTGSSSGPDINLTWTDGSTNEEGFEIWRRRKLNGSTFSAWEMAALTASNVKTFKDAGLVPQVDYEYKVRAVSSSGRSAYTPDDATSLVIKTGADTQAPTVPGDLKINPIGVKKIQLSWKHSTDNTSIKDYIIYFNSDSISTNTPDTTFIFKDLPINSAYDFNVRARDLAGNKSAPSETRQGNTYVSGLYYEHSTGIWQNLDSIDWSNPEYTGMVQAFSLKPKVQEEYFNFRFDGYIFLTKQGSYQFRTGSDDGSRLRIDDKLLVDNNGVHTFKVVTSTPTALSAGPHRITVDFFEYNESDSLLVEYNGPENNNQWTQIPPDVLKSSDQVITALDPTMRPGGRLVINVYPNPTTSENINVKMEAIIEQKSLRVELIDPMGRRIVVHQVEPGELIEGIQLLPVEKLNTGFYLIIVSQGNSTVRQRLIISR